MDLRDDIRSLMQYILEGNYEKVRETIADKGFSEANLTQALEQTVEKLENQMQLQCVEAVLLIGGSPNLRSSDGESLLAKAARLGHNSLLSLLLNKHCNVNDRDSLRRTPLMLALDSSLPPTSAIAQELIDNGADTSATDRGGNNPLHYAAKHGNLKAIQVLIGCKVPVAGKNEHGDTPLHLAVRSGGFECAIALAAAGANPAFENNKGESALSESGDAKLMDALRRAYAKASRPEPSRTQYKAKKYENGFRPNSKKTTRWREVTNHVGTDPRAVKPEEEVKAQTQESAFKKMQDDLVQAREAKTQAEHQSLALQYILDQRSQETYPGSFLFPVSSAPLTVDKLQGPLQQDMQKFVKEVETWQEKVAPAMDNLVTEIRRVVKTIWEEGDVVTYGSYSQKLHLPTSDLDLVVTGIGSEPVTALALIEAEMRQIDYITSVNLISTAFIPILKMQASVQQLQVLIDISIDQLNHSGKNCTALVQRYLQRYKVLRPVLLVLKQILHAFKFHEPFKGGLGSYGLTLMTVHAFQSKGPAWEAIFCTETSQMAYALLEVLKYYATTFQFLTAICPRDTPHSAAKPAPDYCIVVLI